MNLTELTALVNDGKIFGVKFVKRTDGSLRTMSCRVGVIPQPNTTGHERNWRPADKDLLQVWDCHKRAYRMIPVEGITEVAVRGQRIAV